MKKNTISKVAIYAIAFILAFVFLFPLIWMLFTSFKGLSESIGSSALLPKSWTFENYSELLSGGSNSVPIFRWLLNTAVVTVIGTVLVVGVDILAAYSLARLNLPMKKIFLGMVLVAMTVPSIVILFPQYFNFREAGLLNTFSSLILPYTSGTMGVFLIYNFLRDFPKDLEEAAYIDGASQWKILRHVVFPSIRPVVATLSVITFIMIYNDFLWPSLVVNSDDMRTVTVGIATLIQGSNFVNPGKMMASTLIATLPALIIFIYANKFFVKGVNSTGIK